MVNETQKSFLDTWFKVSKRYKYDVFESFSLQTIFNAVFNVIS